MWATAKVSEFSGAINRNLFIGLGELLDEMALHEVPLLFELLQSLIARQKLARVRNILLHQFLHLFFDLFQILGSKRSWTIKIVEESSLGSRAMTELGLRKKLQNRRRQQMGGRMPIDFERLGIALGQDAQVGVFFQRPGEIDEIAVSLCSERGVGEPLANRLGDVERSATFRNVLHAPVGEFDVNIFCHRVPLQYKTPRVTRPGSTDWEQ